MTKASRICDIREALPLSPWSRLSVARRRARRAVLASRWVGAALTLCICRLRQVLSQGIQRVPARGAGVRHPGLPQRCHSLLQVSGQVSQARDCTHTHTPAHARARPAGSASASRSDSACPPTPPAHLHLPASVLGESARCSAYGRDAS